MKVKKLLKANKIAVVGASERTESFGGATCKNIMDFSNPNKYFFINPNRDSVFGKECYDSLDSIDGEIDLVVICTPQETVVDILKQASKKNCKGAVIYASGYKETGDKEGLKKEKELIDLADELGISILGPNSGGFINYIDDVYSFAFMSEKRDRKGKVGLVSQSGQLCLSLMDNPKGKFSYVISAGNANIIKVEDYIDFLVDDDDTKVVAAYLEGVKDSRVFIEALKKAAQKKKPVVILKTGRSAKGSKISESHTGSLAGSDKSYDAIFKKFGVIRVDDMEELLSMSHLLATIDEIPKGSKFAAMSVSGGETIITADMGETLGVEFSELSQDTLKSLDDLLPDYATPNNPLDMTATLSYDSDLFAKTLKIVTEDENIDMIIIGYTLLLNVVDPCIYYLTEGIEKAKKLGCNKPIVMLPYIENTRNPECSNKLEKLGVPTLPPVKYGMSILNKLSKFVDYDYKKRTLELAIPNNELGTSRVILSENESKSMLSRYGIGVPREDIAKSEEEALKIAKEIGYPLVMKIESRDIPHKSDIGGVKVNINSDEEVVETYNEIMDNARTRAKDAKLNGILVQEMLKPGLELIIGVNNEPLYGPMVLCGLGGVFVEIFKDVSLYPAPINKYEAIEMITSLKGYPLLDGYRGGKKLDVDALVDLIVKISEMASNEKDSLLELDMNPIFVYEKGIAIADALSVVKGE